LLVKAIEEVVRQKQVQDQAKDETSTGESRNVSAGTEQLLKANHCQQQADALTSLAEHFIATATVDDNNGIKALAGHERCQLVLHLNVDTLADIHNPDDKGDNVDCSGTNQPANLGQQWLSNENAKKLCEDAG